MDEVAAIIAVNNKYKPMKGNKNGMDAQATFCGIVAALITAVLFLLAAFVFCSVLNIKVV